MKSETTKNKMK